MSIKLIVPHLPESVADATVISWNKKAGDFVNKNDNLVDLETDKVVLEVPAPQSGVLTEILKDNGAIVVSGDILANLDLQSETTKKQQVQDPQAQEETKSSLSPAVRRLIFEHNLKVDAIAGTGKHGNLTKSDVLVYIKSHAEPANTEVSKLESKPIENLVKAIDVRPEQRVKMTRIRAKVAERLLESQSSTAMLTTFNEVNMQTIIDLRQQYKVRFAEQHNIKLGFMSFFVKATIESLKRFPIVNASIDGGDIIYHGFYDIGIAVSTERGLIVPVIRNADQLNFAGIEKNIADFGNKARAGSLTLDDLTGGTFTITNGGIFGSMLSTPILNPPQSAILGMHTIKERPTVENSSIVIKPIMYLALSYDHRLIDGCDAVQFLVTLKECLESPASLLLNI